jgi:hypothetical protein
MPIDPKTVRAASEFFRRVGFAAAKGAAAEVERTATTVAEPLLARVEAVGGLLLENVRAAHAAVRARRDREPEEP